MPAVIGDDGHVVGLVHGDGQWLPAHGKRLLLVDLDVGRGHHLGPALALGGEELVLLARRHCHDFGALKAAAAHPWVDVILARINNRGKEAAMDASVEEVTPVLKQARANGKVVLGMKIFGAGKLVTPDEKDASLKYVFQNNLVDAITVGMLSQEQVDDTIERMNKALKA